MISLATAMLDLGRRAAVSGPTPSVLFAFRTFALAKDGSTHPHERRALLHPNWKILRHPHRKLRQLHIEFRLERIAQFPNLHKGFPRVFRLHSQRWDTH